MNNTQEEKREEVWITIEPKIDIDTVKKFLADNPELEFKDIKWEPEYIVEYFYLIPTYPKLK